MGTSTLFNNFNNVTEQDLIESLVVESIKIYGIDLYYLPLKITSKDKIFREETQADYDDAYTLEMYIKNTDRFEGEGDFLSKFGLEIRDKTTFTVANVTFNKYVTQADNTIVRPREGDLIWFPLSKKLFKISFVEHEAIFYQMGKLQTFDLTCELLEYNNERFNTGIPEIDDVYKPIELQTDIGTASPEGIDLDAFDKAAQNTEFENDGVKIIDWSEKDPFSEGNTF